MKTMGRSRDWAGGILVVIGVGVLVGSADKDPRIAALWLLLGSMVILTGVAILFLGAYHRGRMEGLRGRLCSNCHVPLTGGAAFCAKCGAKAP